MGAAEARAPRPALSLLLQLSPPLALLVPVLPHLPLPFCASLSTWASVATTGSGNQVCQRSTGKTWGRAQRSGVALCPDTESLSPRQSVGCGVCCCRLACGGGIDLFLSLTRFLHSIYQPLLLTVFKIHHGLTLLLQPKSSPLLSAPAWTVGSGLPHGSSAFTCLPQQSVPSQQLE